MENGTYLNVNGQFVLSHPTSGYWVGIHETTLDDTLDGQYVGVWTNPESGVTYYDRSVWVADIEDAKALGMAHKQLAIWDCANETEVWLVDYFAEQFADEV
jgi:hypothetical protein